MIKLKAYDFKCGKCEYVTLEEDHLFEVYMEIYHEHNSYHVRCFKSVKNSSVTDRITWEVFDTFKQTKEYCYKVINFHK